MWILVFSILMIGIFGKLLLFSMKAAWGMTKIVFSLIILPLVLVGLVVCGMMFLAMPILVIVGICVMLGSWNR